MTPTATIRTRHERPAVIAAAVRPDNTDEMSTRVERDGDDLGVEAETDADEETDADDPGIDPGTDADRGGCVVTTIERDSTGGLRTTVDDYVTNLTVAQRLTDTTTQS